MLRLVLETSRRTFSVRVNFPASFPAEPPVFELHGDCEARIKLRVQKALERIAAGRTRLGKLPLLNHCLIQVYYRITQAFDEYLPSEVDHFYC